MEEQTINGIIPKPIFILFAEFLGYDSPLCEIAEKICTGDLKESFYVKIIECDADNIFNQMQKDYSLEEIKDYYDKFFPIALEKFFSSYKEHFKNTNDLPF